MNVVDPEADLIEYLLAQSKRELKLYPRSLVATPSTAADIEASAIHQMTPEQLAEAEREFRRMEKVAA
jgi:hypothetical protein